MRLDLRTALPLIIPKAIAWAEVQYAAIAAAGMPPDAALLSLAASVGVAQPERIRLLEVGQLPLPEDLELRHAAIEMRLLGPSMPGITFGYGVLVCRGHMNDVRFLSHEFRHVHQYEEAGSIAAFIPTYLQQVVASGYHNAAFEADARAYEADRL